MLWLGMDRILHSEEVEHVKYILRKHKLEAGQRKPNLKHLMLKHLRLDVYQKTV